MQTNPTRTTPSFKKIRSSLEIRNRKYNNHIKDTKRKD